jgi:hypothetical protein
MLKEIHPGLLINVSNFIKNLNILVHIISWRSVDEFE